MEPTLIAGLSLVYSLVRMLLVVPVGVLVDRVDRRLLIWAPNLVRGALLVGLSLAYATGLGSLPLLYVAFALVGDGDRRRQRCPLGASRPGPRRRSGPRQRAHRHRPTGCGRVHRSPLSGFLFGVAVAALVAATGKLYAAAGLLFLALARRRAAPVDAGLSARPSLWRDAAEGVAWIRGHRLLGGLAITGGLASVAYMMTFSILVLFAQDDLGLDATGTAPCWPHHRWADC